MVKDSGLRLLCPQDRCIRELERDWRRAAGGHRVRWAPLSDAGGSGRGLPTPGAPAQGWGAPAQGWGWGHLLRGKGHLLRGRAPTQGWVAPTQGWGAPAQWW